MTNSKTVVSEFSARYSITAAAIVAAAIDNPQPAAAAGNRDGRPEFILTIGGSGSGKSTIAAREYPAAVFMDCDAVKTTARKGRPARNPAPVTFIRGDDDVTRQLHRWSKIQNDAVVDATVAAGAAGQSFIMDSTGCNVERMAAVIEAARRGGWHTVLMFVDVSEATSHRRNQMRDRTVAAAVVSEKHRLVGAAWVALRSLPDAAVRIDNDADDAALAKKRCGVTVADLDAAEAYDDATADADAEFSRLTGSASIGLVTVAAAAVLTAAAGGWAVVGVAAVVLSAFAVGGAFAGPGRVESTRRTSWHSGAVTIRRAAAAIVSLITL
tara:strand:- start:275 stop:1252 length:978 start_codon:yes stop_codon:yes gene_type:complete